MVDINQQSDLGVKYQVFGTPCIIFLDSDGNQIDRIDGYLPPDEFLEVLKEI